MVTLLFFRHPETGLNKNKCFRGLSDAALNEKGVKEAGKLGREYSGKLDKIYTSPLPRTMQTATILSGGKVPIVRLAGLLPWDIGDFTGKPKTDDNVRAVRAYAESGLRPPGGKTISSFGRSFKSSLTYLLAQSGMVGVVTHASDMHELGKILSGDMYALDVMPSGVAKVTLGQNGKISSGILSRPNNDRQRQVS